MTHPHVLAGASELPQTTSQGHLRAARRMQNQRSRDRTPMVIHNRQFRPIGKMIHAFPKKAIRIDQSAQKQWTWRRPFRLMRSIKSRHRDSPDERGRSVGITRDRPQTTVSPAIRLGTTTPAPTTEGSAISAMITTPAPIQVPRSKVTLLNWAVSCSIERPLAAVYSCWCQPKRICTLSATLTSSPMSAQSTKLAQTVR